MTPIEAATQALAMERIYTRLFSRKADAAAPAKIPSPTEPTDTYEPSSQRATLPAVTYSMRGGS